MDRFEYVMGLVSIVVGLAIADMASSLHKLLRHRRAVRWDARVLLAAATVFLVLFGLWFNTWLIQNRPVLYRYPFLLSVVAELVLLYLAAAAALPDEVEPGCDLRAFYDATARGLWTLYLLFQLIYVAHWFYFMLTGPARAIPIAPVARMAAVVAALAVLIAWPRRRALHLAVVPLLIAWQLYAYGAATFAPSRAAASPAPPASLPPAGPAPRGSSSPPRS